MSEIQLNTIEEAIEERTRCIMRPDHGRTLPRVGAGYASCQ